MIEGQTPRGWYDVGGGFAGMWDGQQWTGERISHQQLSALTRPAAPPPPMVPPGPSYPPPVASRPPKQSPKWLPPVVGLGMVAFVALIGVGAALDDSPRRPSDRAEALDDLATELRKECDTVRTSGDDHLEVTLDENDPRCAASIRSVLEAWDFTAVDVDRASRGQSVERGKFTLTAAGRIIQIDID